MSKGKAVVAVCLVLYILLAAWRSHADRPFVDEGWLASPALNLLRHGSMYTSILEPKETYYEGIDRYTFWILPAYPVVLAGWFGLAGFSLFTMRALSIIFGCVLLVAMYVIVSRVMKDQATGLLTTCLLAVDFVCVRGGAAGRMDMMCAAFGFSGLAAYVALRERSLLKAFVTAHALVAASVFTHPNGILYFAGLLITAATWDRRRMKHSYLVWGALPYIALLGAWGLYIAHDPALFMRQFGGNASGRMGAWTAPFEALKRELLLKYIGGSGAAASGKIALLVPYVIGVAGALAIRDLRQDKGVRALLALTGLFFLYNWLFEGVKIYLYLVHLAPLYVALFAITLRWVWTRRPRWRMPTVGLTAVLAIIQIVATAYTLVRNSYGTVYAPTVVFVRQHAAPQDVIMGSAELAFGLGFDSRLVDDIKLGFISGKRADVIVLDRRYKETIAAFATADRRVFDYIHTLLDGYSRVGAREDCEVLVRRGQV